MKLKFLSLILMLWSFLNCQNSFNKNKKITTNKFLLSLFFGVGKILGEKNGINYHSKEFLEDSNIKWVTYESPYTGLVSEKQNGIIKFEMAKTGNNEYKIICEKKYFIVDPWYKNSTLTLNPKKGQVYEICHNQDHNKRLCISFDPSCKNPSIATLELNSKETICNPAGTIIFQDILVWKISKVSRHRHSSILSKIFTHNNPDIKISKIELYDLGTYSWFYKYKYKHKISLGNSGEIDKSTADRIVKSLKLKTGDYEYDNGIFSLLVYNEKVLKKFIDFINYNLIKKDNFKFLDSRTEKYIKNLLKWGVKDIKVL